MRPERSRDRVNNEDVRSQDFPVDCHTFRQLVGGCYVSKKKTEDILVWWVCKSNGKTTIKSHYLIKSHDLKRGKGILIATQTQRIWNDHLNVHSKHIQQLTLVSLKKIKQKPRNLA